jgi:hypothetical protein
VRDTRCRNAREQNEGKISCGNVMFLVKGEHIWRGKKGMHVLKSKQTSLQKKKYLCCEKVIEAVAFKTKVFS